MRVSIAIPGYNEAPNLPELLGRVGVVLDAIPGGLHEIVIVDDGSTDATEAILRSAAERDRRIVGISLSRNFGHQAALSAALDHASGDVVITMDGDLQDAPEVIPAFIEKYHQGYDVVYAQRIHRKEACWLRACYWLFYRLLSLVADFPVPLDAGDFALLSRRVVDEINQIPERQRSLRAVRAWVGFRQIGIPVERKARYAGRSKYGLRSLLRLAFDGISCCSALRLRSAVIAGRTTGHALAPHGQLVAERPGARDGRGGAKMILDLREVADAQPNR